MDNFSVGQSLYVLVNRCFPTYDEAVREKQLNSAPEYLKHFIAIIRGLTERDPDQRWSAKRALHCLKNCDIVKAEVLVDTGAASAASEQYWEDFLA